MTSFADIYSRFMMKITDHNLDTMFAISEEDYENYIYGFLQPAADNFTDCSKDLTSVTSVAFTVTLTGLEKDILATLMAVAWSSKEVNSIMELKRHLNDTDFKLYAESQHLREKKNLLIVSEEAIESKMTRYGYQELDTDDLG